MSDESSAALHSKAWEEYGTCYACCVGMYEYCACALVGDREGGDQP